jgi:beta-glucosidase-like glycosyl hydrolase
MPALIFQCRLAERLIAADFGSQDGTLHAAEVDRAVRQALRLNYELGLFNLPYIAADVLSDEALQAHLKAARRAARQMSEASTRREEDAPVRPQS